MKILVIDDNKNNLESAEQQFIDHDLTVIDNYDEASQLLERSSLNEFDAVLCDLLMPAGKETQGPVGMKFVGQEMPVGWSLAIRATLIGARFVAVVSDTDHHDHPASAMLDAMRTRIMNFNGSSVLFTNYIEIIETAGGRKGKNWQKVLDTLRQSATYNPWS